MTDREFFEAKVHDKDGVHTIGDLVGAILSIHDEEDATHFYRGYRAWMDAHWNEDGFLASDNTNTPDQIVKSNIGWCYGEGMPQADREMWIRVSGASHPVFGQSMPSPTDAFATGQAEGKRITGEKASR